MLFANVREAAVLAEQFRIEYNEERSHMSLGYLTPAEFGSSLAGAFYPRSRDVFGLPGGWGGGYSLSPSPDRRCHIENRAAGPENGVVQRPAITTRQIPQGQRPQEQMP